MKQFPNCEFPIQSTDIVYDIIRNHISLRKPFSLIRVNDGEGILLSLSDNSQLGDVSYLAQHFGGFGVRLHQLFLLKKMLVKSIINADIVGVRDDIVGVEFDDAMFDLTQDTFLIQFRKYFPLCKQDMPYQPSRRIALLHQALTQFVFGPDPVFTSCWIHFDLHLSGHIFDLISNENKIGLITSKPLVAKKIAELFDCDSVLYNIPEKYVVKRKIGSGVHFPRRFFELNREIKVEFEGMVFLVAAGLCGKIYCEWIREKGGIALDLGSLFDAWVGIASRPVLFSTRFKDYPKEKGTPQILLLNKENVTQLRNRLQ